MNVLSSEIKLYSESGEKVIVSGNLTITNSIFELTTTVELNLSKKNTYIDGSYFYIVNTENQTEYKFKRGQKVEINLGYDDNYTYQFIGWISSYSNTGDALTILIEDNMYLLKHMRRVKGAWKNEDNLTLSSLMEWLIPTSFRSLFKFDVYTMDMNLGNFTIKNYLLPSEILKMLKEMYNIYAYFRNGNLYVGHQYWDLYEDEWSKTFKFAFPYKEKNNFIIENNLNYLNIDTSTYKVKGSSVYNNEKIEYSYPEITNDPDNVINLNLINLDLNSLKVIVKEKYDNLDKGGFTGDITTFGIPVINVGDIVDLTYNLSYIQDQEQLIKEKYYVNEVITSFGTDGYNQQITLGNKITENE